MTTSKQPQAPKQVGGKVDRTGKTRDIPGPKDLRGPAGDPVEGNRPGGSSWPA